MGSEKGKGHSVCCDPYPVESTLLMATTWISLIVVTPVHPASYTTLMTIVAAHVRTPIAIVPIGAGITIVAIGTMGIAVIPIGTMGIAVVAVPVAVISTAICTPVDAGNAPGC